MCSSFFLWSMAVAGGDHFMSAEGDLSVPAGISATARGLVRWLRIEESWNWKISHIAWRINGGETWRVLLHINKRLHWSTSRPPSLHLSYSKPFLFMLGCFWDIIGTLISNQFVFTKFTSTNFPIQHKTDLHKIKKCSLKFCGLTSFWTMIQTIYLAKLAKSNVSAKFCFDWVLIGMKKLRFISVTWTI